MSPLGVLESFLAFLSHIEVVLEPFPSSRIGLFMVEMLGFVLLDLENYQIKQISGVLVSWGSARRPPGVASAGVGYQPTP